MQWTGDGTGSPVRTIDISDAERAATVTFEPIQISIDDVTVNENDGTAIFTVSLNGEAGEAVTVEYATANNTAVAPGDYAAIGTTLLTFSPGQTSKTIDVTIQAEDVFEGDEIFYVNLSNQSANATIAKNQGIGTILNDDYTIATFNPESVKENSGPMTFTVTLDRPVDTGQTVTIDYTTTPNTAGEGTDYLDATGTLNFTAGQISWPIDVTLLPDADKEGDETFSLTLTVQSGNATPVNKSVTGTILNDDYEIASIGDKSENEDAGTMTFTVTLDRPVDPGDFVGVGYSTANGSADLTDYTGTSGGVNFNPGQSTGTIVVAITDDPLVEPDEDFKVILGGTTPNATILDTEATGWILNDDYRLMSITDEIGDEDAGVFTFTVTLDRVVDAGDLAQVRYTTSDIDATAGSDYTAVTGTVTFNPGESQKTFNVTIIDDAMPEGTETFRVDLTPITFNVDPADWDATGTITDEDYLIDSIGDVVVFEDEGTATFRVTLNRPVAGGDSVTVRYATSDGSATQPADYAETTGTVTFNPGENQKTFNVPITDDAIQENPGDETFRVTLSDPSNNAFILDNTAQGTIYDEDYVIATFNNESVPEKFGLITFTVTLDNPVMPGDSVVIDWVLNDDTATVADNDYVDGSGTLTFTEGQISKTVDVTINPDAVVEADEKFTLALTVMSGNVSPVDQSATGTIVNDDYEIATFNDESEKENSGPMTFTVTLNSAIAGGDTVTIDWALGENTATLADNDYVDGTGTLTFTMGQISKTVDVYIQPDAKVEGDEEFTLDLTVTSGNVLPVNQSARGTILNDDYTIDTFNDEIVSEIAGMATFTVTLDRPVAAGETVVVGYTTVELTATEGTDYDDATGTLNFMPGEDSKTIDVTIHTDPDKEPDETFRVDLTVTSGNVLPINQSATGTIVNDDYVIATFNDESVKEDAGPMTFTVTLDRPVAVGETVTIDYTTVGLSATEGTDYDDATGSLTFSPGETSKTVDVTINDDPDKEPDETFTLSLTVTSDNATPANPSATGTILNEDYVIATFDDVDVAETGGPATFTVTLDRPVEAGETVTMDYTTAGVTAIEGADFDDATSNLTFTAGQTSKTIDVTINNDTEVELAETFTLTLTVTSGNATPANPSATGTILVDDAYVISIADSADVPEGGTGTFAVTINPAVIPGDTVEVVYQTFDGTAKAGELDYSAKNDTLTFNVGESTQDITVTTNQDTKVEFVENFTVELTAATTFADATFGFSTGNCNILIDDKYQISVDDILVDESVGNALFTVSVSPAIQQDPGHTVEVAYTTNDGTATEAGNDYTTTSGTLTFNASDTSHTIAVPINNDNLVEFEEIFVMDLINRTPPEITEFTDPQGECNILIDEIYEIAVQDTAVGEGDGTAQFTVSVTPTVQVGYPFSVTYATADGMAQDENGTNDYTSTSGTLIFNPGESFKTVDVTIINDRLVDPGETFDMVVSNNNPTAITSIVDNTGTCSINDNNWYLNITKSGTGQGDLVIGSGSVSGLPGGTESPWPASTQYVFENGDQVTLDVTPYSNPYPGSRFKVWSGDLSGSSESTSITIDNHKNVDGFITQLYYIATLYNPPQIPPGNPPPLKGSISPAGVAVSPPTPDSGNDVAGHVIVEHDETPTFTFTPAALDWNVVKDVLVDGSSVAASVVPPSPAVGTATYTFPNVTANHKLGANYDDHGGVCPGEYTLLDPAGNSPQVEIVNGEFTSGGDVDMFKVVLPAKGILTTYTEGVTDTFGYLLDASCNEITHNDDASDSDSNFKIQASLDAGAYFIKARHWNPTKGTGAYRLFVLFDPDDHGSNCATATEVDRNSTTAGNLVAGDYDYFKFVMPAPGIVTTFTTGSTDTFGYFLDSNCNVIIQDDDTGTNNNFQIVREVGAGTYHVAVRHKNETSGTGAYDLEIHSDLTYIITATASYGGTISPSGAVSVPEGGNQSFNILSSGVNAILTLEVDGTEIAGAVGQTSYTYNFTNVTSSHTIAVTFDLPQDACLDISDTPLDARYRAAPANIMFVMDDSGSMDWSFLTTDTDGMYRPTYGGVYAYIFDDAGDNVYNSSNYDIVNRGAERLHWQTQWSGFNRIYYNPAVDYDPWPTLGNAHMDTPRSHPFHESPTFDLEGSYETVSTGVGGGYPPIIVDDQDAEFTLTPAPVVFIINDRDPEFSRTATNGGQWRSDTDSQDYNDDYYYTRYNGDYTATWAPSLPPGDYEVQAMWRENSNYSDSVDYVINHAGGSDTVTVSQNVTLGDDWQGGKWNILGIYTFNGSPGENVQLQFTRSGGGPRANADAVRFRLVGSGWNWATSPQDYGEQFYYTPVAGDYTAVWTPDLPAADTYEVSVWYVDDFNRSTAVPYEITYAGGATQKVFVDQRAGGGAWVSLGTYSFDAGTGGTVTMSYTVSDPDTQRVVADAVRFTPSVIPPTIDIHRSHYYVWSDTASKPYLVNIGQGDIAYAELNDDGDDVIETGELVPELDLANVPDDVKTGRTYAEERQNFANWYSFYRRRELTATAAIANVIVNMQGVNIGFASINDRLIQPVLPVNVGTNDATAQLLNSLYGLVLTSNGTPLRRGLEDVGEYFHADDGQTGGIGASPYETADNGGECQQAFAIVMTDGYWNGGDPGVGNTDKDEAADPDNSIYDGPPYEDNWSNTLADVAMHYYESDLSPEGLTMDDGNPGLNDLVPTNIHDGATHQHMATYTVSFGVNGTLNPADYDLESTDSNDWPAWPDPDAGSNTRKIDDLWHASVNGRGTFTSAANPIELRDSLISIMQNIEARIGSASSVSINGDELYDEVSTDIRMFQASYNSDGWTGDVKAHSVDLVTGSVEVDTWVWSAADELKDISATNRVIATYDGSQGIPFRYNDPGMTSGLKHMLDVNDATNAENMLNYIRGDATNEEKNGGAFRNRIHKLGDIVHSSPKHTDGYLYAGGNDGMLHAFDASDGREVWAYVPMLVFNKLKNLTDPLYVHDYYVDLTPTTKSVQFSGTDKTILVGGLRKGGRGYYAIDITNPGSITTESELASRVMWEYPRASTPPGQIDDIGFSFSQAAIVNSEAGWIVIVGNGYNSVSGKAKLLVLDAETGALIKSIDTGVMGCNGLSVPVPIDVNYDDKVDYVYAGDLKGNLWKFDFTVPGPTDPGYNASYDPEDYWDVAYKYADPYTYSGLQQIGDTPMPLF